MGITGFDRLLVINTISTERKLYKTKVNLINGKNNLRVVSSEDNAQIEANMNKVFSLINEDVILGVAA